MGRSGLCIGAGCGLVHVCDQADDEEVLLMYIKMYIADKITKASRPCTRSELVWGYLILVVLLPIIALAVGLKWWKNKVMWGD